MVDATVDSSHVFFGTATQSSPLISLVAMALLMGVSLIILRWRLNSTEVSS
jgi:hypothetical protein